MCVCVCVQKSVYVHANQSLIVCAYVKTALETNGNETEIETKRQNKIK